MRRCRADLMGGSLVRATEANAASTPPRVLQMMMTCRGRVEAASAAWMVCFVRWRGAVGVMTAWMMHLLGVGVTVVGLMLVMRASCPCSVRTTVCVFVCVCVCVCVSYVCHLALDEYAYKTDTCLVLSA